MSQECMNLLLLLLLLLLFILQILLNSDLSNADWLLTFETTDFNIQIFNENIKWLFTEFIKIWFLFNQTFSIIMLCWFKWVINKSVVEFKLLNSTWLKFSSWVELREINLIQMNWVRLSIQLNQLDELT